MKISEDSFRFSKGVSEKFLGFRTLLRNPDKLIMAGIEEMSRGIIVVCGKPLKI